MRDGAALFTQTAEAVMRDVPLLLRSDHVPLVGFLETKKPSHRLDERGYLTTDSSQRLSSAHDKVTWHHTERTADFKPNYNNVRSRYVVIQVEATSSICINVSFFCPNAAHGLGGTMSTLLRKVNQSRLRVALLAHIE